jgi:hypothetical protein
VVKFSILFPPHEAYFPLTFLPFKVQNFICLAPTVTNSLSFIHAIPLTLSLSTLDVQIRAFVYQSNIAKELSSSLPVESNLKQYII